MGIGSTDDASGATLLECDRLRIDIRGRTLIDALTLRIAAGELWCVLGANGVGKTMLLHTLAGLHRAAGGTVMLGGKPIGSWPLETLAHMRSFLPQVIPVAIETPVIDVVLMGRHPHLVRWQWEHGDDRQVALAALAAMDIAHLADRDAARLSGGERQRVAIAALLAQDASILLLDEPVAHLDLHHQVVVLEHLRALSSAGRVVVLSIHDLNLARRFATHALLVHPDGSVRHGAIDSVMDDEHLSAAFGHAVERIEARGRTVFVAR